MSVVATLAAGCGGEGTAVGSLAPQVASPTTVRIVVESAPSTGYVLEPLTAPIRLRLVATDRQPLRGVRLHLQVTGDDALTEREVTLEDTDRADVTGWRLGSAEGEHLLRVSARAADGRTELGSSTVTVRAIGRAAGGRLRLLSPSWALTARTGLALPRAIELRVEDAAGRALADTAVHLLTTSGRLRPGAAMLPATGGLVVRSDAHGIARIEDWELPPDGRPARLHAAVRGLAPLALEGRAVAATEPTLEVSTFFPTDHFIWDMAFAPDSSFFYTRRAFGLAVRRPDGTIITYPPPADAPRSVDQFMYGLALDPDFAHTRWVYTVQASEHAGRRDLRLVRHRVSDDYRTLEQRTDLRTGFHVGTGGGYSWHMSARGGIVRFLPDSTLLVTIGFGHELYTAQGVGYDAAKTFHLRRDGSPADAAPLLAGAARDAYTMGHRNPQGLVSDRRRSAVFLAEHGPGYDDEVNRLTPGGNYGWYPICDDGARSCEWAMHPARFMTDTLRIPGARLPLWRTGAPAWGTSGLVLLEGGQWGGWDGHLLALQLRGRRAVLLELDDAGATVRRSRFVLERGERLRSAAIGPDGALYVARDSLPVLRVAPRLP